MYKALLHETWTKRAILYDAFKLQSGRYPYYRTDRCTDSARICSLPHRIYLNQCHLDNKWKIELRKIGYRIPKSN